MNKKEMSLLKRIIEYEVDLFDQYDLNADETVDTWKSLKLKILMRDIKRIIKYYE